MTRKNALTKFTVGEIIALFRRSEYDRRKCIVINRSKEPFGGLLNMAAGYPLVVNGIMFGTLEHLYQCLRFPDLPRVQKNIISKPSPLVAKWVAKPHRKKGRPDWFEMKFELMDWCLRVKLAQHYDTFGKLLDQTGRKVIVETSPDGDLWGGIPSRIKSKPHVLVGSNIFGKLLMRLRDEYRKKSRRELTVVELPDVGHLLLVGKKVGRLSDRNQTSRMIRNKQRRRR